MFEFDVDIPCSLVEINRKVPKKLESMVTTLNNTINNINIISLIASKENVISSVFAQDLLFGWKLTISEIFSKLQSFMSGTFNRVGLYIDYSKMFDSVGYVELLHKVAGYGRPLHYGMVPWIKRVPKEWVQRVL